MLGLWGNKGAGLGGIRRISACIDAAGDAHRTDPGQGPDRDHGASRAHDPGPPYHRPLCGRASLAWQTQADRPLPDTDPVHPVRTLGPCQHQPVSEAGPRPAGLSPLSRRPDRNLDADAGACAAHRQHGTGRGARLRGAADLFHLHHSLDAAAGFLALDLYRLRRGIRAVLHGDVLSSRRQRRSGARSRTITPCAA